MARRTFSATESCRAVLGLAAGFGGGYWVGLAAHGDRASRPPSSLWVSVAVAVVLGTVALVKVLHRDPPRFPPDSRLGRVVETFAPWRWSAARLGGYAVVNIAVAAGIAAGFTPRPLA